MKRILALALTVTFLLGMTACGQTPQGTLSTSEGIEPSSSAESETSETSPGETTGGNTAPSSKGETDSTVGNPGGFDLETATVTLNSGYEMPIMGLGTYSLSDEECYNSVTALLEAGGRLIDTAYMYHNEAAVGRAIRDSDVPREEIFVITKLYPSQFDNPEAAIDLALETLDIGYIDLLLLHHPGDGDVEAYLAIEQAVAEGKVHSIGLSNWYIEELEEFLPQVNITPALVQNEIHPYYQEPEVVPYIQSLGITVQGWYPFGGRGHTSELLGDETISAIAEAHGVTSAQVILRWNLQRGVVVIPKSTHRERMQENLEVFDFTLSSEDMERIAALDTKTSAFFAHDDPAMVEWFAQMVEQRKTNHDAAKEKKNR